MATYTDDFNRANGALGADWTDYSDRIWFGVDTTSTFAISSNKAIVVNAGEAPLAEYNSVMDTDYPSVSVTVGSTAPTVICLILQSNGTDYVYGYFHEASTWGVYTASGEATPYENGTETVRASRASQSFTVGDVLTFEARGTTYMLKKNGVVILIWSDVTGVVTWADSSHRHVGMMVYGGSAGDAVDDFAASDVDTTKPYIVASDIDGLSTRSPAATFPNYTPLKDDIVVLWPSCSTTATTLALPSGWQNPLGGNTDVESDAHQMCCVYHVVTAAEETAGTQTYTATNLYNQTRTMNIHAVVVRNTAGIDAVGSTFSSTDTVTPHVLAGLTGANLEDDSLVLSSVSKDGTGLYALDGPSGWDYILSEQSVMSKATLQRTALTVAGVNVSATNITPSAGDEYISITLAFMKTSSYRMHNFRDNFAVSDTNKWEYGASTSISGGQMVSLCNTNYDNTWTNERFNLTGSSIFVEVPQVPAAGNGTTESAFQVYQDTNDTYGQDAYMFYVNNGQIHFWENIAGVSSSTNIAYNATNHRWWRIRESGGTIYWDTSADGISWTNRRNKAVGINITALHIGSVCGYYGSESSPVSLLLDNLNTHDLPKSHTLRDNFASGIDSGVWDELDDPADVYPSGGGVRMNHDNTAANYAYLQTSDFWDATESVCFVELIDAGNQTLDSHEAALILFAEGDSNNQIDFQAIDGMLGLFVNIDGVGTFEQLDTYNSTDHRWLRIREAGGSLYFDTAPDGTTWTNHHSMTTPFNLTAASIILLAGASQAEASGSYAIFDNFNTQDLPKAETLTDDFTGGTLDTGKWTADFDTGGSANVVDNRLRLETGTADYSWSVITSNDHYDLTDSAVYVQIPDPGNRPSQWAARLALAPDPGGAEWMRVYISDEYGVVAQVNNDDYLVVNEGTGAATYVPSVHRWLRIRESNGFVYFAFSADGVDWTEPLSTDATNWSLTAVRVILETQITDTTPSAAYAWFDHFNTPWSGPVFRSAGHLPIGAASANVNIPVPSGVVADDVMLAFIFLKNSGGAGIPSQTMSGIPSGFTAIGTPFDYAGTRDIRVFTYWKRATGADAGTYNFTLSSSHPEFSAYVARYSGCVTTGNPYDTWNANANDSDTTPAVSVTTSGTSRLLVHANVSNAGYEIVSPASAYVLDASGPDDDSSHGWGILSREQDVAGTSGSVTADWHTSHYGVSVSGLFALRATAGSTGKQTEFMFMFE